MAQPIDPITLQVINGALQTIAEEMGHVLYRMSFSSIIRESQDLGAGLFDTDFNTLCESESTPLHIGSLPGYLAGIQETLQDGEWHDGDLVIHNHPYHGSSHSPDIAIVVPIFHERVLVGFSANTAHHLDIGAATPGLIIDIPDVFAEGMLFAGTKLYERGKRNDAVWSFIGRNSRAARQLQDDLDAQIASARLGAKRFAELMDHYGRQMVLDATKQLMDYTERVLRQRIAAIPDGEYRAEGFLDDDGKNRDVRLPIKVCVRIKGDDIEIDLTGSSKQVETAFNVPFEGSTKVACFCAIRSLLLDAVTSDVKVPSNQGSFRPVKVTAPKGSIYNPIYPAAAEARFAQINRVIDLIYKALAPVLPNDIIAGSSASLSFCSYAGIRPSGDYWVFLEVNEGSYGGRPRSDGPDSIDSLMANTRNNPIEDLAMHLPMICDRYELRDDVMPGAGRSRGGIGVVKAQRVLTDAFITHENERHFDVPWGIFGGDSGQVGKVEIYNVARPDHIKQMPAKFSGMRVAAGDVQGLQRGRRAERQQQGEPGLPGPVMAELAAGPGQAGEYRDAEDGVRRVPVSAADPPGDPGDRLGQEAQAPGRRRPALVQVREQRHARGETGQRRDLRDRQVQEDARGDAGDRAGQRVRVPQHLVMLASAGARPNATRARAAGAGSGGRSWPARWRAPAWSSR